MATERNGQSSIWYYNPTKSVFRALRHTLRYKNVFQREFATKLATYCTDHFDEGTKCMYHWQHTFSNNNKEVNVSFQDLTKHLSFEKISSINHWKNTLFAVETYLGKGHFVIYPKAASKATKCRRFPGLPKVRWNPASSGSLVKSQNTTFGNFSRLSITI